MFITFPMWDHGFFFFFLLPSHVFKYPLLLDLICYSLLNDFEQEITCVIFLTVEHGLVLDPPQKVVLVSLYFDSKLANHLLLKTQFSHNSSSPFLILFHLLIKIFQFTTSEKKQQ